MVASNNSNINDSIDTSSIKLSKNVQRLALNNVTDRTLRQENSLINTTTVKNLKPIYNNNENNNNIIGNIKSSIKRTTFKQEPLLKSNNIQTTNNGINQVFAYDKENRDPRYDEQISNAKDRSDNIKKSNIDRNSEHTSSEINNNNENILTATNNALKDFKNGIQNVKNIDNGSKISSNGCSDVKSTESARTDSGKKRPISTVVEHEEPKKFKVCDENGEEEYVWEDLDAEDINDPFMVSEYVNDIFEYLHHLEIVTLPIKEDLFKHRNIRQNRDILVNWLVKIHNKFGLLPETLYLAINIMDRFLCKELVQLDKLQLVGTSCLFIAAKYEEVYSPSIKHFASETDGACTEDEIKEGEKFILKTLEFNLNYPNPMNFLRRISKADDYDIQSRTLAKFLLEISLVDFRFIGIIPSLNAAAAMFLSRKMLGKGKWDGNLIHYSGGYNKEQLAPVCHMIMDYLTSPIVHDEFHRKYQSRRFMKASVISVQWALKVRKNGYDIMTLHETT